ncbi:MAG: PAS domain-containing sensor histidine kinase [Planctomycetota bacterium]
MSKPTADDERERATVQARSGLAFDFPSLSFWEFDLGENRMTVSHWFVRLGHDAEAMPQTIEGLADLIHPDDRERVLDGLRQFRGGKITLYSAQFRLRHADGHWVWIESRARMVNDTQGKPERIVGIHYDITDLKQAHQKMLEKNEELQSLVYATSHELKSPLVTVKGFVGLLKTDLEAGDQDRIAHDMNRIADATDGMSAVIDDLLALSRMGRDGLSLSALDLHEIIDKLQDDFEIELKKHAARLVKAEPLARPVADPHAIMRVLYNLVDNAIRYGCDEPDKVIEVGSVPQANPRGTLLYVRDQGPGIDPKYHERIFKAFERLSRRKAGTGVGLASVQKAAELHGGRAWVESIPGEGSCFKVFIPSA